MELCWYHQSMEKAEQLIQKGSFEKAERLLRSLISRLEKKDMAMLKSKPCCLLSHIDRHIQSQHLLAEALAYSDRPNYATQCFYGPLAITRRALKSGRWSEDITTQLVMRHDYCLEFYIDHIRENPGEFGHKLIEKTLAQIPKESAYLYWEADSILPPSKKPRIP